VTRCVNLVTSQTDRFVTGVSYMWYEIHAIAKDQYPRYRSPNGAEAFDKGRILGRYVASPWSRTSGVVAARGV